MFRINHGKILRAWYSGSRWLFLLYPVAWCYRFVIFFRFLFYRFGIFKTHSVDAPVIVIGNITLGGTGKTPLVIWCVNWLKTQGFKPGVVSRGYGASTKSFPCVVNQESSAKQVGDEALLVALNTHVPVIIDPDRVRACKKLIDDFECDFVVSDDGLQHYRMERDLEVCAIDAHWRFGNGRCLPAGPLREPVRRLKHVDFTIFKSNEEMEFDHFSLKGTYFVNLATKERIAVEDIKFTHVHAVAGIGNPQQFFNALIEMGLNVHEHSFADHANYEAKDFNFHDNLPIIMTEKDAVKCKTFATNKFWYLAVEALPSRSFIDIFSSKVTRLSSLGAQ